jgi:regulator of replication initiation timing
MVQVKGLLMELGDWQQKAAELERENTRLRAENERLRAWVEANK